VIVNSSIEDLLQNHLQLATTDPWPEYLPPITDAELVYSALVRCACGAGMAYSKARPIQWGCSDIFTGRAKPAPEHSELYPFYMWTFKPENSDTTTRATL
jgi:hypothetical protein